jgi:hypothetical protein
MVKASSIAGTYQKKKAKGALPPRRYTPWFFTVSRP